MKKTGKILALDYGASTIGLAITDLAHGLIFGRGTISMKNGLKKALQELAELLENEKVNEIVLGLPLSVQGAETKQTTRIREFAKKLKILRPELKIHFEDESFSSYEAQNLLKNSPINTKDHKKHEDELAAILILQRFMKNLSVLE